MKKQQVLVFLAVLLLTYGLSFPVKAGELPDGKKDRKGFFIGFGVGGGGAHLTGAGLKRTRGAFLSDFKIGGAITEKILLMYDGSSDFTRTDGTNFFIYQAPFAVQWFCWDNLYIRPGIGLALATASVTRGGTTLSTNSKVSIGANFAAGYEFRLGKRFSLSPEAVYRYAHLRQTTSGHAHTFGVQASMLWYF